MRLFSRDQESREKLQVLEEVIAQSHRGVFKRIDENRELLELLYREAPELMNNFPWIRNWIVSQDEYLNKLAEVSGAENPFERPYDDKPYPRAFPEQPE
ncbi:hypothetical protein MK605_004648 [Escherichia coli]|jgi:hypothetical protein|uniref:hypothetical protein n=1 Tax=Enterobacteriaceae TaxID=543 RepID=UPI000530A479